MASTKLKVLTLNCWGVFVPLVCKDRYRRMKEIGIEIGKGNFDIVFLQEVWLKSDYQLLCDHILPAMPYCHYYYGGIIGTGLCLFSKFKIIETSQYRFSLNGYAHRFMCGDWMADKSVGLAKILVQPGSIKLNVYITHLHAQYSEDNTYHAYEEHRCLQAFELAKFIRDTSCSCDCVVVGGDFNVAPQQVGYDLITSIGNVQDSWKAQKDPKKASIEEPTCGRLDNIYSSAKSTDPPVRIDYILHRNNAGYEMECTTCDLTMGKVPGQRLNFSDHEGVVAEFTIKRNLTAMSYSADYKQTPTYLEKAMKTLDDGTKRLKTIQRLLWLMCIFISLGYVYQLSTQYDYQRDLQQNACSDTIQQGNLLKFQHSGEEQHVEMLHQQSSSSQSQRKESLDAGEKIYFFMVELMKVVAVIILVFSLVHSCLVLSRELIVIKSANTDMINMMNFYKDIDG